MATGDAERGRTYLELARNRAKEAIDLLGRPNALAGSAVLAAGAINEHTAKLVTDTLASADGDSRSGMQLLGKSAVAQLSADPLAGLDSWLPGQRSLLTDIVHRAAAGVVHYRAQTSLNLLQRVAVRSDALKKNIGCPCLSRAVSDDLGPVPCSPCKSLVAGPTGGSQPPPASSPARSPLPAVPGSSPAQSAQSGRSNGDAKTPASALDEPLPSSAPSPSGALSPGGPVTRAPGSGGLGVSPPGGISVSLPLPLPPIKIPGLLNLN
jgi:hypothetical protein